MQPTAQECKHGCILHVFPKVQCADSNNGNAVSLLSSGTSCEMNIRAV
jgi:hypothetical protein